MSKNQKKSSKTAQAHAKAKNCILFATDKSYNLAVLILVFINMQQQLSALFTRALQTLKQQGIIPLEFSPKLQISPSKNPSHGDYATNLALVSAKAAKLAPMAIAKLIVANLPANDIVAKTEIAAPGFINIFIGAKDFNSVLLKILKQRQNYGKSTVGAGKKVLLEFVSANPTGPLHVGHGRGAAYGSALANLLAAAGFEVDCEYYVNDAGRQMDILAVSVWLRYLERHFSLEFVANAYQGAYVAEIAAGIDEDLLINPSQAAQALAAANSEDAEKQLDQLIAICKQFLGNQKYQILFNAALEAILHRIKTDLSAFLVEFDNWFSEQSLYKEQIEQALQRLTSLGFIYQQDGAKWFCSSKFGDEKDRVVMRDNGSYTYFASDIAYHLNKFTRGYQRVVNIWGQDHHGYQPRIRAAMRALGQSDAKFEVLFVQFANLFRGSEKLPMSTRSGQYVSLSELCSEVGTDAARFFYLMRRCEQHMDFDLELAKSQTNANPVYYVQYAHARICSVLKELENSDYSAWQAADVADLELLNTEQEQALIKRLSQYPQTLENAAQQQEVHQISYYLRELAHDFHSCYNAHKVLVADDKLRNARVTMYMACQLVLQNALAILGISAPLKM